MKYELQYKPEEWWDFKKPFIAGKLCFNHHGKTQYHIANEKTGMIRNNELKYVNYLSK